MCNTMDSDRPVHLVDFPHCGSQQRLPLPRSTRIPTVRLCTFDVGIIKHFSPKINPVRPCMDRETFRQGKLRAPALRRVGVRPGERERERERESAREGHTFKRASPDARLTLCTQLGENVPGLELEWLAP